MRVAVGVLAGLIALLHGRKRESVFALMFPIPFAWILGANKAVCRMEAHLPIGKVDVQTHLATCCLLSYAHPQVKPQASA